MADNVAITPGSGATVAADEVTYSGDTTKVQIHREVHVSGAEGSKTLTEITDTSGRFVHGPVAHDAVSAGNPLPMGGYASAAAPSGVSADGDAVRAWLLRNGAQAVVLTAAGALIPGDATTGLYIGGAIAHDGVDSGNPIKIGMRAVAHGSNPTAVAAADRTDWLANRAGVPFMIGGHPNVVCFTTRIPAASGAQTDLAIGPGTVSAGTKVVVTRISVKCSNANSVSVAVKIGFGATSIPADTATATGSSGILCDHEGVPPGGGFVEGAGSGILGIGADGEELRFTCDSPTGGHVIVSGSYYTIDS